MLAVLIGLAAPARAATITFAELVRTVGASGQLRPATEVRLRLVVQGGASTQSGPAQGSGASSSQRQTDVAAAQQQTAQNGTQTPSAPDPTLSQSGGQVQTVDLGDVTGTVCDCGEIPPPAAIKGGFPWWPFLGGAVIPFLFPRHETTPPETPPITPPQTPIPEPMTLLLFGSGLLALGARRRRGRRQAEEVLLATTTTEEV